MHKDVVWFDTAACWKGAFIGQVNSVTAKPDTSVNTQYTQDPNNFKTITPASDANSSLNGVGLDGYTYPSFWNGWYTGAAYSQASPEKDDNKDPAYNKLVSPHNEAGPFQR